MSVYFSYSQSQLKSLAQRVISQAISAGATSANVIFSEANGLHIEMRQAVVRTRTLHAASGMSLTVFRGQHQGTTTSSDFSDKGLEETVQAAMRIARFTGVDEFCDLFAPSPLPATLPELDLYHPWSISEQDAIALATEIEAGIHSVSPEVTSDGAWVSAGQSQLWLMNSLGFSQGTVQTHHAMTAKALGRRHHMSQLDFWSSEGNAAESLMPAYNVGSTAAQGACLALDIQPLAGNHRLPVLFAPLAATSLLSHLVQATSGAILYQGNSYLCGQLGSVIAAAHITVTEDPFIPRGLASRLFDGDGIRGKKRKIVENGRLLGYFLSAYSARRMNMDSTGNAWGPGNLRLTSGLTRAEDDFNAMLNKLDNGLVISQFSGGSPNLMNGDYSRSLRGFWVENGKIQYAVDGITVAGNLADIFKGILAVGNDAVTEGPFTTGSVLIDSLQISGNQV
ncbi:TldD/PmbA family protein [Sodalis sp. RH16]|uniref:TldD/PmbA family protein n=1 Tax=Sodalis sp. RH16 TaxID=3394331 RepID=UPI0039B60FB1